MVESNNFIVFSSFLSIKNGKSFCINFLQCFCHLVTRQMKTITYSLASTKCMEEGWTVRPESPAATESEIYQDPFVIEVNPLQLVNFSLITFSNLFVRRA